MVTQVISKNISTPTGNLLVVGLVRNCAMHLREDVYRLKTALSDFDKLHWLLVESDSDDESISILNEISNTVENFRFVTLGNLRASLPLRTERIAHCRNAYLDEIRQTRDYNDVVYVAVSDFDGCNKLLTQDAIRSCWKNNKWDVCTANQDGPYYDIWALRHEEWSPNDYSKQKKFLERYNTDYEDASFASLYSRMITVPKDSDWIEVNSAYGGFAIYKKEALMLGRYIGMTTAGEELCEHVPFHQAIREQGRKIYINPSMINAGVNEHSEPAVRRQLLSEQIKKLLRQLKSQHISKAKKLLGERGFNTVKLILRRRK
jgi:hypothetical protein